MNRRTLIGIGAGAAAAAILGISKDGGQSRPQVKYNGYKMLVEKRHDIVDVCLEAEVENSKGATVVLRTDKSSYRVSDLKESAKHCRNVRDMLFKQHRQQMEALMAGV